MRTSCLIRVLTVVGCPMSHLALADMKNVNICADESYWPPYLYFENGTAKGVHWDVLGLAMQKAGYRIQVTSLPWVRCQKEVEDGKYDGAFPISYKDERATFLNYPDDAKESTPCTSSSKLSCVSYSVMVHQGNAYEYDGKFETLPSPVRAPSGYSIVADIQKAGVTVETAKGDVNNVRKLARDKLGSVVLITELAELFLKDKEFDRKIRVSHKPLISKSYHIAFSKKGAVSGVDAAKIWKAIGDISGDKALMNKFYAKY